MPLHGQTLLLLVLLCAIFLLRPLWLPRHPSALLSIWSSSDPVTALTYIRPLLECLYADQAAAAAALAALCHFVASALLGGVNPLHEPQLSLDQTLAGCLRPDLCMHNALQSASWV